MRTILGCEQQLARVDELIRHKFIPALTGGHIINNHERQLLALPPRLGGQSRYSHKSQIKSKKTQRALLLLFKNKSQEKHQPEKEDNQVQHERHRNQKNKLDSVLSDMYKMEEGSMKIYKKDFPTG